MEKITKMAHDAGITVYIEAVEHGPRGPIDVQKLECDFLISSAYKFLGPHSGILYGKHELLEKLFAYKVHAATISCRESLKPGPKIMRALQESWAPYRF